MVTEEDHIRSTCIESQCSLVVSVLNYDCPNLCSSSSYSFNKLTWWLWVNYWAKGLELEGGGWAPWRNTWSCGSIQKVYWHSRSISNELRTVATEHTHTYTLIRTLPYMIGPLPVTPQGTCPSTVPCLPCLGVGITPLAGARPSPQGRECLLCWHGVDFTLEPIPYGNSSEGV